MAHHSVYRKIWEEAHGPIPTDPDGRTYEIHHIDGDRENSNLSNLACLSIEEHYKLHLAQGDYKEAMAVYHRMKQPPEEAARICSEIMKARMAQPEEQERSRRLMLDRWANDEDYAERTRKMLAECSRQRAADGTHNFYDPEFKIRHQEKLLALTRGKVRQGTHNFQSQEFAELNSKRCKARNAIKHTCPHCGKEGKGVVMKRHHFDRCKLLSVDSGNGLSNQGEANVAV